MVAIILSNGIELGQSDLWGESVESCGGFVVVICLLANLMSLAVLKHILLLLLDISVYC